MLQLSKTKTDGVYLCLSYFAILFFENHMTALTIPVHDQKFGWTVRKSVIAASAVQHKSLFIYLFLSSVLHMHAFLILYFLFLFVFLGLGGFSHRNNC